MGVLSPLRNSPDSGERRRLEARFPFLADYPQAAAEAEAWIRPHYQEYVQSISKAAHALSLPTAVFLRVLCRGMRPSTVLDLGSGFSSFVLRSYAEVESARVTSVDDSDTWIARTAEFLESRGVPTDRLLSLEEFRSAPPARYDLVLTDDALPEPLGQKVRALGKPVDIAALRRLVAGVGAVGRDEQEGWYVEPSYKTRLGTIPGEWGLFVRYNVWDNNAGSSDDSVMKQINSGLNYWPIPDVVFKFDVQAQDNDNAENDNGFNLGIGYQF